MKHHKKCLWAKTLLLKTIWSQAFGGHLHSDTRTSPVTHP